MHAKLALIESLRGGEATISSFDTSVDDIGRKEGYGQGNYKLFPAEGSHFFGDDFREILQYFKEKREGRLFNTKADVSPMALKAYLPWISLVEPIYDDNDRISDARVTLHGSSVAAAYTDNTNRYVREIHKNHVAERVLASMQYAVDRKQCVIGVSEEREVKPPVRLTILYLPLVNKSGKIYLFLSYVRLDRLN